MHLLLPPSEAKSSGGRGRPLRDRLTDDPLDRGRARVLAALSELLADDRDTAARSLLLPPAATSDALRANASVLDSPTTPALRRYAGVVYDGFDHAGLAPAEQRLAARTVHVFSGLFGVLHGGEPVPMYRVPAKAVLPGVGIVASYWRPVLAEILPARFARGLVVDLRSSDYAAMWRADVDTRERLVTVRVLSPTPRGTHAVVSYVSKLAKGRLAAALVRRRAAGRPVANAADVAEAWTECGGHDVDERSPTALDLYTA